MLAIFQINHTVLLADLIAQFAIIELHHDQPLFETLDRIFTLARLPRRKYIIGLFIFTVSNAFD